MFQCPPDPQQRFPPALGRAGRCNLSMPPTHLDLLNVLLQKETEALKGAWTTTSGVKPSRHVTVLTMIIGEGYDTVLVVKLIPEIYLTAQLRK